MNKPQIQALGMVWYLEETFQEAKRLMADSHTLHNTYAEWLKAALAGEQHHRAAGTYVVRAIINPTDFKQWCEERGLHIDSKARNAFAN